MYVQLESFTHFSIWLDNELYGARSNLMVEKKINFSLLI